MVIQLHHKDTVTFRNQKLYTVSSSLTGQIRKNFNFNYISSICPISCLEETAFTWVQYHPQKIPHPLQKPGLGRCFSFSKEVVLGSKCWVWGECANPSNIAIYLYCLIHPILGFVKMTPEIYQTPNPQREGLGQLFGLKIKSWQWKHRRLRAIKVW